MANVGKISVGQAATHLRNQSRSERSCRLTSLLIASCMSGLSWSLVFVLVAKSIGIEVASLTLIGLGSCVAVLAFGALAIVTADRR